uniref:Peptidase C1A papain C-terminal domain-containing protein n=1 Tax=Meloidogyne incognita TaxID=6306 RepID=A0A914LMD8_MELIC
MFSIKFGIIFLLITLSIWYSLGVKKGHKKKSARRNEISKVEEINDYTGNKWKAKFYSQLAVKEQLRKLLFGTNLNMPTCEIKKENQTIEGTSTRTRRDVAYSEDIPSSFIITEKWPECIEIFQHAIENGECSTCWAIAAADSISSRICIRKVNTFREKIRRWSEQTDIISKEAKFMWDFSNLLGNLNDDLTSLRSFPSNFANEEESMREAWTVLLMLEWVKTQKYTFNSIKEKVNALEEFFKWIGNKNLLFYKAMDNEAKKDRITLYWCQFIERKNDDNDKEQQSMEVETQEPSLIEDCLRYESDRWNKEASTSENIHNYDWSFAMKKIFISKLNNSANIVSAIDLFTCSDNSIKKCNYQGSPAEAFAHSIEKGIQSGTNSDINSGCKPYPKSYLLRSSKTMKCEEECTNKSWVESKPKKGIVRLFIQWENCENEKREEDSYDKKRYRLYKSNADRGDFVNRIKKEIMREGPVVAFLSSSYSFTTYSSGIYQRSDALKNFDDQYSINEAKRSVLIIGWGQNEEGEEYWVCKASIFNGWGENGIFRILQGNNELGIEETIMFPEIRDPETWHLDF